MVRFALQITVVLFAVFTSVFAEVITDDGETGRVSVLVVDDGFLGEEYLANTNRSERPIFSSIELPLVENAFEFNAGGLVGMLDGTVPLALSTSETPSVIDVEINVDRSEAVLPVETTDVEMYGVVEFDDDSDGMVFERADKTRGYFRLMTEQSSLVMIVLLGGGIVAIRRLF